MGWAPEVGSQFASCPVAVAPPAGAVSAGHLCPWSGLDRVADRIPVRQVGDEVEVCSVQAARDQNAERVHWRSPSALTRRG
jgi:hypothetical protein